VSLFNKSKPGELNQIIYNLLFKTPQPGRDKAAYFCEHDGICINFTRAKASWHALVPCALKPWWLRLKPLKKINTTINKITTNAAAKAEKIEVIDNA